MIPFTLYCFTQIFDLTYSGDSKKDYILSSFFETGSSAAALNGVVIGNTAGSTWVNAVSIDEEICDNLPIEHIRYAYRKIFKEPVKGIATTKMVKRILKNAVNQPQEIQKEVYSKRGTPEVEEFINSFKLMSDVEFQTDDIFIEAQEANDSHVSEKSEIPDGQINNLQFYNTLKTHLANDNISELRIAFHGGAEWINPNSEKFPILTEICKKGIPIKVAVNRADAAESIAKHMRDINAYNTGLYLGFENNINRWKSFLTNYKECYSGEAKAELRLIRIPLLHSYVSYVTKDKDNSIIKVVYYTYSNPYYKRNPYMFFSSGSDGYELYRQEFQYLWDENSDIIEL